MICCCSIRENNYFNEISEACKTLDYKDEKLELSFFCPCVVTNISSSSSLSNNVNLHRGEYLENDCCTVADPGGLGAMAPPVKSTHLINL